jgi:hypothetical protein
MAFYLVTAVPKHGVMEELAKRLTDDAFIAMKPLWTVANLRAA